MPPHLNKGRGRSFRMPLLASGISSSDGGKMSPDADPQLYRPPTIRIGSSDIDSISVEARPAVVPASVGVRPALNVQNSRPQPLQPSFPQQKQMRSQFESINASNNVNNLDSNGSLYVPEQQLDNFGNKQLSYRKLPQLPNQRAGQIPLNHRNQVQVTHSQPQFPPQEAHPSLATVVQPNLVAPPLSHGYIPQGHGATISTVLSNCVPGVQRMLPNQNIANSSLRLQGGALPPLPPGPPPTSSQMIPLTQNAVPVVSNQQTGSAFTGLIGSLMAQGLISLTKPTPVQVPPALMFLCMPSMFNS
jgi:pre-mRNA cleavage complex 2 protein Pcf11